MTRMMCPACARGDHTGHAPRWPGGRFSSPARCLCPGDCRSEHSEALARLQAAGVIAPRAVYRMD